MDNEIRKPWKLRVDWTVADAYPGEPVDVELHIMGEQFRVIHREPDAVAAVGWAVRFFRGRGFAYTCDVDRHQRCNHTYIVMHPCPQK